MTASFMKVGSTSTARWLASVALALLIPAALPALAQTTVDTTSLSSAATSDKEVNIEANSMEVKEDQKKAIFTGKVNATRGDVRLNADKLVVDYVDNKGSDGTSKTEVTFLKADGNVVITTQRQKITGDEARMDVKKNLVWVEGNVKVVQGNSVLTGEKLFADLKANTSQMTGGRVKGSFVPKQ